MAEISVIVPVYQVEKYLIRCAESLLSQTFSDLEVILVDDGSTDGSPQICEELAEKDSRVHVIHQENGGLSAARNVGLDDVTARSDSSWLFFQDSDDWLHPETMERLLSAAKSLHTPIAVCGYGESWGEEPEVTAALLQPEEWTPEKFYSEKYINATIACGKLYRRECFHRVRFPVGKLNEDEYLIYRVLFSVEKLAFIPAPLYAYYVNPYSITHKAWSPRRLDAWEAMEQQIHFFRVRGYGNLADQCLHRYLCNAFGQLQQLEQLEENDPFRSYIPLAAEKTESLLKEAECRKCLNFDEDFALLSRFRPIRTQLQMYGKAAMRRLKGAKHD